ncbi:protein-S-isoprenylcysteine O-methyltransferase isoform X1 [Camelus ferus]|uniref:Protein-S-isoprenylcysteine O-methyltransferase n=2 Tax=Camelus TaxID=9836 RepID=A0A8B8U9K9_CAMFR|nr:protein-S-isoprenylcysteine O-methyltransferase isoform X1 [Camelus ferus]
MAGCAARAPPGSEARLSLATFLLGASVLALPLLTRAGLQGRTGLALYVAGLNALLLLLYRPPRYQIAIRACFLGFVFGCGVLLSFSQSSWNHFGWYMCSLSLFHYSEYLVTAVNNPKSLSLDSFLLNHSLEYTVAALSSWIEFTLENIFWPELKQITWLSATGLLMVVFGECLRKAAMFTAGSNFNHVVQNEKSETHTLVTRGVYAWFRHPSYVGWFYWSIGTQVVRLFIHGCLKPGRETAVTGNQGGRRGGPPRAPKLTAQPCANTQGPASSSGPQIFAEGQGHGSGRGRPGPGPAEAAFQSGRHAKAGKDAWWSRTVTASEASFHQGGLGRPAC